ncbi:uncharacterized protein LOC131009850 [Salvia miltiorrhiza]|uniref:uncharacterized protein LOC131009850 n=1 Tax=Salvia miltiorrhiza TaxID=226208 RepID=UPI0025AD5CBB|nr:uncharacterized protein LOC131009850 [Salvia miltiorrhiza]
MVVWKNVFPVPATSISHAINARMEWLVAWAKNSLRSTPTTAKAICKGWHAIPLDAVKCDVDAAFFKEDGSMVHNHEGAFIRGKSFKMPGLRSVEEGELIGIKEALSWLKELGFERGWVDSDSKRACDVINTGERNILELGAIASHCRDILELFPGIRVRHIRREQNAAAHYLAKAARDINSHHVWNEPPSFVVDHLHVPCSCDQ